MPLFGPPNIEKLKAKSDVKGLIKALRHWKVSAVLAVVGLLAVFAASACGGGEGDAAVVHLFNISLEPIEVKLADAKPGELTLEPCGGCQQFTFPVSSIRVTALNETCLAAPATDITIPGRPDDEGELRAQTELTASGRAAGGQSLETTISVGISEDISSIALLGEMVVLSLKPDEEEPGVCFAESGGKILAMPLFVPVDQKTDE